MAKNIRRPGGQTDVVDGGSYQHPDVMLCAADEGAAKAYSIVDEPALAEGTTEDTQRCGETEARPAEAKRLWTSLLIEAKRNVDHSPFVIPGSGQDRSTQPEACAEQQHEGATPSVLASVEPSTVQAGPVVLASATLAVAGSKCVGD